MNRIRLRGRHPAHPLSIAWLIGNTTLASINRLRLSRRFTAPPILIGGCGRSGTTLLLSILSAHPKIAAISNETAAFCQHKYNKKLAAHFNFDNLYANFFLKRVPATCDRWCEKTPSNITNLDEITRFFKDRVKIIHIVRDGRDVVLSKHPSRPSAYYVSPERWINDVTLGKRFENHPSVHTVRYEDLIRDFDSTIREVCAFLELEPDDNVLDWFKNSTITDHKAWVGGLARLHTSSMEKWRKPENRERVEELTKHPEALKLLEHYGYMD